MQQMEVVRTISLQKIEIHQSIGVLVGSEDIKSSLHSPKTNISFSISMIYKQKKR